MTKQTLKERLKKKQADLKARGGQGSIYFLKADTSVRVRILSMGEEEEFIKEVVQYYLGSDIKGVISPTTFGEPCAITEGHEELKNSDEEDDNNLASQFPPRNRYLAFCIFYKDDKGKEIDTDLSPRFILLSSTSYQDILELYLDEEEWGDMTDPINGYDIKVKRTGSGKMDTEYTVTPCKPSRLPKQFNKTYNLDEEVRKIIPSYETTKELLSKYLGVEPEEEEEEKPRSRNRKTAGSKKRPVKRRKTKRNSDDLPF